MKEKEGIMRETLIRFMSSFLAAFIAITLYERCEKKKTDMK